MSRRMKVKISPDWFECPEDCVDDDTLERDESTETEENTEDDHDEREQFESSQSSSSVERPFRDGRRPGVVLVRFTEPIDPTNATDRETPSRAARYEATYPCSYSALEDRRRDRNRYRPNQNRYLNTLGRGDSRQPAGSQRTRRRNLRPIRMSRREQHNRWRNRYGRNPRELS